MQRVHNYILMNTMESLIHIITLFIIVGKDFVGEILPRNSKLKIINPYCNFVAADQDRIPPRKNRLQVDHHVA